MRRGGGLWTTCVHMSASSAGRIRWDQPPSDSLNRRTSRWGRPLAASLLAYRTSKPPQRQDNDRQLSSSRTTRDRQLSSFRTTRDRQLSGSMTIRNPGFSRMRKDRLQPPDSMRFRSQLSSRRAPAIRARSTRNQAANHTYPYSS